MSTTSSGTDLPTKYQKLAAEYAKLRAQLPVLKQALIEERSKVTNLEEELREKDRLSRTLLAESESLTFRNQQLTKRVEFLQEQLDDGPAASTPSRLFRLPSKRVSALKQSVSHDQFVSSGNDGQNKAVLEEELRRKLDENEKLNQKLFEQSSIHQKELAECSQRAVNLKEELKTLGMELASGKERHEAVLDELRVEKTHLRGQLDDTESNLAQCVEQCRAAESARSALEMELKDKSRLVSDRVLVDDGSMSIWNWFNVQTGGTDVAADLVSLVNSLHPSFSQTVAQLTLFHSYCEERTRLYPHDTSLGERLSQTSTKYAELLRKNANACRLIERAVSSLVDNCSAGDEHTPLDSVASVVQACQSYQSILSESVPCLKRVMEDENSVDWCNSRLAKENTAYADVYAHFVGALTGLIASFSSDAPVEAIDSGLIELSSSAKALQEQYARKIADEHQLPVATRHLRTTNECVAASLNSLSKYLAQLSRVFQQQHPIVLRCLNNVGRRRNEWDEWRKRASEHFRMAGQTPLDTVKAESSNFLVSTSSLPSYCGETGSSSQDKEWRKVIEEKQNTLAVMEKEKEKWILETHLLRMKLEQYQRQGASGQTSSTDGQQCLEAYYEGRLAELSSKLQDAYSRAVFFQSECQSLTKALHVYHRQREKLQTDAKTASQQTRQLTDELETTRKEYESQLSTLSEHLAQMNQQVTKQAEEMDMLRRAATEKAI